MSTEGTMMALAQYWESESKLAEKCIYVRQPGARYWSLSGVRGTSAQERKGCSNKGLGYKLID